MDSNQSDRRDPARRRDAVEWMDDPTRRVSLCCECGTVRDAASGGNPRGANTGEGGYISPELIAERRDQWAVETSKKAEAMRACWAEREPWSRCVEKLKCRTCGKVTPHAYIRNDEHHNYIEDRERARPIHLTFDMLIAEWEGMDNVYLHERHAREGQPGDVFVDWDRVEGRIDVFLYRPEVIREHWGQGDLVRLRRQVASPEHVTWYPRNWSPHVLGVSFVSNSTT